MIDDKADLTALNPVQNFDESMVDLSEFPNIYEKYVDGLMNTKDLENGKTLKESIIELRDNPIFVDMSDEDKKSQLEITLNEYSEIAKKTLREEHPVIDQLILDGKLKQDNIFQ